MALGFGKYGGHRYRRCVASHAFVHRNLEGLACRGRWTVPTILGTNQDLWVARLRHNEREPSELVETFRVMRQLNVALWMQLSPVESKRTGRHNERGPEFLDVMLRMMAGHDLSHLDQIARHIQVVLRETSIG